MGGEVPAGSPEWSWNAAWDECHGVEREVRAKVCGVPRCRGVLRASPQCSLRDQREVSAPLPFGRRPKTFGIGFGLWSPL